MRRRGGRRAAIGALSGLVCWLIAAAPADGQTLKYAVGMFGKFTAEGMLIESVVPGRPAERAGLRPGDVIVKVDGRLILTQEDFTTAVNTSGGALALIVRRGNGRPVFVGLDLVGRGPGPVAPYFLGVIGDYGPEGMRVRAVGPGTPAARVGLERGDTIVRINGRPVTNQAALFDALYSSGGLVRLDVRKGNGRGVRLDADLNLYELGVVGQFGPEGMLVGVVAPGTPAAAAGLLRGDVILRIDNQPVRSQQEFNDAVNNSGGGLTLLVRRGNQQARLPVDLVNNPLGAWCEPTPEGMRVTSVIRGGPAELAGLERGDVILRVDEQRVRSQAELLAALRGSRGLATLLVRKARTQQLVRVDVDLLR